MSEIDLKEEVFFVAAAHDPLDCNEETITELEEAEVEDDDPLDTDQLDTVSNVSIAEIAQIEADTTKSRQQKKANTKRSLIDEIIDELYPRIKYPVGLIIDIVDEKKKDLDEQTEKRMLKNRLITMKNRFLLELDKPEEALAEKKRASARARQSRAERKKKETPEEKAARLERQRILSATSRKRQKELETPEQRAERMAKDREFTKLRMQKKLAAETPEQRAARRQRQKAYEEKRRSESILTKTGKLRRPYRIRKKANEKSVAEDTAVDKLNEEFFVEAK